MRQGCGRRTGELFCKPCPPTRKGTVSLLAFGAPVPSAAGGFHVPLTEPEALSCALLCLLVSRTHAKEAEPSLGSIERNDRAGRINIVPDFIFTADEPADGRGQAVELALPLRDGGSAVPWLACRELAEPGARWSGERAVPLSLTKGEPFHCCPLGSGSCGTAPLGMAFPVPASLLWATLCTSHLW